MHTTARHLLTSGELDHIKNSAALDAWTISERLNTDRAEVLLDNIDDLNACADLARWAMAGATGSLSDHGLHRLRDIRDSDREYLEQLVADPGSHSEDIEFNRDLVASMDRAISIVEATR